MCEEFQLNDLSIHKKNVVLVGGVSSSSCSGACVYMTCAIKVPHQFYVLCFRESVDHFHVFTWLTLATISSLISNLKHIFKYC